MSTAQDGSLEASEYSMVHIRSHEEENASYGRFRLCSDEPRKNLTTVADRVAARLAGHLIDEHVSLQVMTSIGYVPHLPNRLGESAALRDCVALACSAWANFRRSLPADQVIDLKLHGKALRSVQRAVDGPQSLTAETLAAVTLLERLEIVFDANRPRHRAHHAHGIQTLMMKKGPPDIHDEMDIHLAIENHAALMSHWVVEGGDNFFLSPSWKETLSEAIENHITVSPERRDAYTVGRYFSYWPELVQDFRLIHEDENIHSKQARIAALRSKAESLQAEIEVEGEAIIQSARSRGLIVEEPDQGPIGAKFRLDNLNMMGILVSYVMFKVILNRIMYNLNVLQGEPTIHPDSEHKHLCRQIWMLIPFAREQGLIASMTFTPSLHISFEGADEAEKEYLLDFILDVAAYKGVFPSDRKAVETFVLNTAKAAVGQMPFDVAVKSSEE